MVGDRYLLRGPRPWRAIRRTLAATVVAAALVPAAALAAGPDELAQTIEQNLSGIEFRVDFAPERAVHDLNEQKRQLRMLETQAPDHPRIPELNQRIEALEAQLAEQHGEEPAEIGTAPLEPPVSELLGPREAPREVVDRLREVDRELSAAEAGMLQGQTEVAADHLGQADELMTELETEYADQIPAGHVPLIVAKERLEVLRDQIGAAQ